MGTKKAVQFFMIAQLLCDNDAVSLMLKVVTIFIYLAAFYGNLFAPNGTING